MVKVPYSQDDSSPAGFVQDEKAKKEQRKMEKNRLENFLLIKRKTEDGRRKTEDGRPLFQYSAGCYLRLSPFYSHFSYPHLFID
jgi:hypothetical protein